MSDNITYRATVEGGLFIQPRPTALLKDRPPVEGDWVESPKGVTYKVAMRAYPESEGFCLKVVGGGTTTWVELADAQEWQYSCFNLKPVGPFSPEFLASLPTCRD